MFWCLVLVVAGFTWAAEDDSRVKQTGTQFWTDDYRVFDHIYGRTSDKHIYGSSLLPAGSYRDFNPAEQDDAAAAGSTLENYGLTHKLKYFKNTFKPAKNSIGVFYNALKPITEESDPKAYHYLKRLELMEKHLALGHPSATATAPRPRGSATEHFTSIRDILDAHEEDEHIPKYKDLDRGKYLSYPLSSASTRCGGTRQGGCRKRSHKPEGTHGRYPHRPRPVIRKIKTIITE